MSKKLALNYAYFQSKMKRRQLERGVPKNFKIYDCIGDIRVVRTYNDPLFRTCRNFNEVSTKQIYSTNLLNYL